MIENHVSAHGSPRPRNDPVIGVDLRSLMDAQVLVTRLPIPTDVAFRRIVGIP